MHFQYTAKSASGETLTGLLEAQSPTDVRQLLRQQGLFALSVNDHAETDLPAAGRTGNGFFSRSRVTKRDLLLLSSQLAIMTQSGIDLAEALKNAAKQCTQPRLKAALDEVYDDVSGGKSPSAALAKQSHIFGEAYVASVAAGEASGNVPQVLNRLSDLMRNEMRLQSTLKSVLSYPIVITIAASVVMSALVFFVLPQFAQVFKDLDAPAPPLTKIMLDSAQFVRNNVLWIGIAVVVGGIAFIRTMRTPAAKRFRDGVLLNTRIIRNATRPLLTGRAFRLIGTMIQSGVPLLEAMRLCRTSIRNIHYRQLFDMLEQDVLEGRGISTSLSTCPFVPPGAAEMIVTAEKTGKLGTIMETVGEFYEDEGERQVRDISRLLEPAIIVSLGIVVAMVVLSVMLPLLDFSSMSH